MKKTLFILLFLLINPILSKENTNSEVINITDIESEQNKDICTIYFLDKTIPTYIGEAHRTAGWQYNFSEGFMTQEEYFLTDYSTNISVYEIDKVVRFDGEIIEGKTLRSHNKNFTLGFHTFVLALFITSYFIE